MFENLKIYNPNNIMVVLLWVAIDERGYAIQRSDAERIQFKKTCPIVFTKQKKLIGNNYCLKDILSDDLYKSDMQAFYNDGDIIPEELFTLNRLLVNPKNVNVEELFAYRATLNEYFIKEVGNDKKKYRQKILQKRLK